MKYKFDEAFGGLFSESDCVEECLSEIWEIGYGYDGYNKAEGLKSLIDEILMLSRQAEEFLHAGKVFTDKDATNQSLEDARVAQRKWMEEHRSCEI